MAEAEATEAFRLEVDGWDLEESDAAPESGPAKRRKLSLSLKPKDSGSTERFVFLDNAKVEALNKRYVPYYPNFKLCLAGLGPSSLVNVLSDESKVKLEIAHFEKLG